MDEEGPEIGHVQLWLIPARALPTSPGLQMMKIRRAAQEWLGPNYIQRESFDFSNYGRHNSLYLLFAASLFLY